MYYYNITFHVAADIAQEWTEWMETEHIPAMLETTCFEGYTMTRLINREADETFAIQFVVKDLATLQKYMREHAGKHETAMKKKYGESALSFQTVLEVLKMHKL